METVSLATTKKWWELRGAWRRLRTSVIASLQQISITHKSNIVKLRWEIGAMGDDPMPQYVTNNSSAWSNKVLEMHKSRDSHVSIKSERLLDTLNEAELSPKQFGPRIWCSFASWWCRRELRFPNIIFEPFTDKEFYASCNDFKNCCLNKRACPLCGA